jgi:hypothetical protein
MESRIDEISRGINKISRRPNLRGTDAVLNSLMGYFTLARHAHEVATCALLKSEDIAGFPAIDRRRNLLNWNMGARILAKEIRKVITNNPNAGAFFEIELDALESARAQVVGNTGVITLQSVGRCCSVCILVGLMSC